MSSRVTNPFDFLQGILRGFVRDEWDSEIKRSVYLLILISLIGIFTLIPLGAISFVQGHALMGALDIGLAGILTINLLHARIYKAREINNWVGLSLTGLLFLFAFLTGGVNQSGFVWYYTFPLLASYILGSRKGLIASALLLTPVLVLFAIEIPPPYLASYSLGFKIRFLPSFLVVLAFSYLIERTREQSHSVVARYSRALERTIGELHEKEEALRSSHQLLEDRVRERTAELASTNEMLEQEIAERRNAENELERKNIILTTQQEASQDGMLIVDKEGAILSFNRRFMEIWGIPARILDTGSDDQALRYVLDKLSDPVSFTSRVEYLYNHPTEKSHEEISLRDGRVLDRHSSPMIGSDGRNYGRVWYFRDITSRKQAEEKLRDSEERYRRLISHAMDSVFILDPTIEGGPMIVEANDSACKAHGYSMDELTGMSITELNDNESAALAGERVKSLMAGNAITFEANHIRKDGSAFPVEATAKMITLSGKPYILAFDRDITDRKAADDALRTAKMELERQNLELRKLDSMKDALISDVSHELKTPVAKHVMQVEILKSKLRRSGREKEFEDTLSVIESSIRRQQNVIRNILMMSRLESGPKEYEKSEVRLDIIIEEILADFDTSFSTCGVEVTKKMTPLSVHADKELLWHVYSNIINNALKYRCTDNPRLNVSLGRDEDRAVVLISDNGVGMTAEEQVNAFERFYQASPAKEGIGLGLNISKIILKRFGGEIRLDSKGRGCGTTAVTTLPLPSTGE